MNSNSTGLELAALVVLSILSFAALVGIVASVTGAILYLAWNAFMPGVFGVKEITFLQAFALTFLLGAIKGLFSININKKED